MESSQPSNTSQLSEIGRQNPNISPDSSPQSNEPNTPAFDTSSPLDSSLGAGKDQLASILKPFLLI